MPDSQLKVNLALVSALGNAGEVERAKKVYTELLETPGHHVRFDENSAFTALLKVYGKHGMAAEAMALLGTLPATDLRILDSGLIFTIPHAAPRTMCAMLFVRSVYTAR